MSVIIKGMDMPKSCEFCRCICGGGTYIPSWRCGLTNKPISNYKIRNKNCPLVALPEKHGRLIDVDEYCALQGCDGEDDDCRNCIIRDCGTILESEE